MQAREVPGRANEHDHTLDGQIEVNGGNLVALVDLLEVDLRRYRPADRRIYSGVKGSHLYRPSASMSVGDSRLRVRNLPDDVFFSLAGESVVALRRLGDELAVLVEVAGGVAHEGANADACLFWRDVAQYAAQRGDPVAKTDRLEEL